MIIRRMKISPEKLDALREAITQLGNVTFDRFLKSDASAEAILNNRSCYYADIERIRRLQDARSAILDEYEKAFDTSDIPNVDMHLLPTTILEVQLDVDVEMLLKEASEAESKFFAQFF